MRRVMAQGDFRPMAQNREAMADLVAILDARSADYARAEAELDTSGDAARAKLCETDRRSRRVMPAASGDVMTLADQGFLDLGDMRLEYRMIGPRPDDGADHRDAARRARLRRPVGRFSGQARGRDRRRRVRLFARGLRPVVAGRRCRGR